MRFHLGCILCTCLIILSGCQPTIPKSVQNEVNQLSEPIDYNLHVKPILSDRCFACHGNDQAKIKAGLRLDIEEGALSELPDHPGKYAIVPGKINRSQLFHRIIETDPEKMMPPPESNLQLTDRERAILTKWIEGGAEYKPHWSFTKPGAPVPPINDNSDWSKNAIDQFVLAKLRDKKRSPNNPADKEILLRRVTLDLTGLPPTPSDLEAFRTNESPDALERVVDRLLESPHYGERMAADWMDLARFADTHGYTVDRFRDMSPWRDWVIQAFNKNMPYDQFVTWQLAGDLLPNATKEQILATGFNRNHKQNMEGGIVDEEFRVEYVSDRTNTLGTAFLGLTLECAKCHDHKYDPISQKEYFQFFSFFNNVKEAGQISFDNETAAPSLLLTTKEIDETIAFLKNEIDIEQEQVNSLSTQTENGFTNWLHQLRLQSKPGSLPKNADAHYSLENDHFVNKVDKTQRGIMKQQHAKTIQTSFLKGVKGSGLLLDGDAWLDLTPVGRFDRTDEFTISCWVKLPQKLKDGVILHKGTGAALYNYRGYHLALKNNRLELLMANNAPNNAIIKYGEDPPREQWIHLALQYDGSSKADGLNVYLNGNKINTITDQDNLFKTIEFQGKNPPGVQFGARWRGAGVKNTVVDEIMVYNRKLSDLEINQLFDPEICKAIFQKEVNKLTNREKALLKEYYNIHHNYEIQNIKANLKKKRSLLKHTLDTIPDIMVMQEMDIPRSTRILARGAYDTYADTVYASTPEVILGWSSDLPKNRLGLAKWLFDEDHPLTARVVVNRIWQMLFMNGLVKTVDDFGFQGSGPSHPELLDWLANDFKNSGWNIKRLVKTIVLSSTYQQSSIASIESMAQDPENTWLGRGPSSRLTAEMMRDNVLAACGLLEPKIGGPSVKPYQPDGLWKVNGGNYVVAIGPDLYRRSLYTFWKRSVPNPTLGTFDAPDKSACTVERQKTSTPLQALVLLNDPTYIEAAKVLGEQITQDDNLPSGITKVFISLTGRRPTKAELNLMIELQENEYAKFDKSPSKMIGWLKSGAYQLNLDNNHRILAANTVVASTIMNTDATITKR